MLDQTLHGFRSLCAHALPVGQTVLGQTQRLFTTTAEDLQQLDASIVADEQVIYGLLNDFAEAGVLPTKERLREAYIRKMQPGKGK